MFEELKKSLKQALKNREYQVDKEEEEEEEEEEVLRGFEEKLLNARYDLEYCDVSKSDENQGVFFIVVVFKDENITLKIAVNEKNEYFILESTIS